MMGWFTLMLDACTWSPGQDEAAKQEVAVYKEELRPLIPDADLYHVSERPDGLRWDGVEYRDSSRGRGVLYPFRGSGNEKALVRCSMTR